MTSLGLKTGLRTSKGEAPDFFGGLLSGLKLRGLLTRARDFGFTDTSLGSSSRLTREFEFPGLLPEECLLSYLELTRRDPRDRNRVAQELGNDSRWPAGYSAVPQQKVCHGDKRTQGNRSRGLLYRMTVRR